MSDQAQRLRNLIKYRQQTVVEKTKIITITSGKGGVGKSNFTLNFALSLQARGKRVLIFDADIGLANIDVLMGASPKYSLYHLLHKEKNIEDIIQLGPGGIHFIAGGSGFTDLVRLSEADLELFSSQIGELGNRYDYILFDTGAGLSKETLKFIVAAEETIVVTTPEPTSITDAYAIMKMVCYMDYRIDFRLVVNRVSQAKEGKSTADKISIVAKRFLQLDIPTLGYIQDDPHVSKAVKKQVPFTIQFPHCAASRSIREMVDRYLEGRTFANAKPGNMKGFLQRMMKLLS